MKEWFHNINEGHNDDRFNAFIKYVDGMEATVPDKDKERMYQDLRDFMESRRKRWHHAADDE